MGYNLADAKELAEISTLYMHVGDGIDIDQASSSLVSTMKGFHMEAEDAMSIIDKFNEVANTNPIESGGIGEALRRSAASFYMANTDLSSAIALITASNSVAQDPENVGNMWKTVSARIRGAATEVEEMGEDTEGMVESTSKLRDQIMAMTGFDIMKDDNTFKDMREIIVGIGQEWDKLSDIDQAALLEKLAGKNHANTLAAVLSQYEMINDVYETAENSEGSALREQEEYK
jgi:TP901 family phage tail tape measure protein